MKILKKFLLGIIFFIGFLVLTFLSGFYYVDMIAGNVATKIYTDFNDDKTCYVSAYYIPYDDLEAAVGIPVTQIFFLFRGPVFYRVYDKNNELLVSTQWNINEMSDLNDHARWIYHVLIYPGNSYESLKVPEC